MMRMPCPACFEDVRVERAGAVKCGSCGHNITRDAVVSYAAETNTPVEPTERQVRCE